LFSKNKVENKQLEYKNAKKCTLTVVKIYLGFAKNKKLLQQIYIGSRNEGLIKKNTQLM